jgi:hypothetical protein
MDTDATYFPLLFPLVNSLASIVDGFHALNPLFLISYMNVMQPIEIVKVCLLHHLEKMF